MNFWGQITEDDSKDKMVAMKYRIQQGILSLSQAGRMGATLEKGKNHKPMREKERF